MQTHIDDWRDKNLELLNSEGAGELSFVELVLAATECSEDESEIFDLVDDFVSSARAELTPLNRDHPTVV
jgi:hypothetical protein